MLPEIFLALNQECTQEYLPQLLLKNGYETTYLQASPLPYMLKDIFMKQAGFDYCYGTKWHKYSYSSNYWGVDDKAFFEQAFDLIALKKYMRKTPEEEYAIYKKRILRGESEESARAGLKQLKKRKEWTCIYLRFFGVINQKHNVSII